MIDRLERSPWLRWFLIFLVVGLAYWSAYQAGFIWDDDDYVTRNPVLRGWQGLGKIWFEPSATRAQYYPLVLTSLWVDWQFWGMNPLGYHLVNLLLQALSACLLVELLRRLRVPGALFAALLFAVHPVQVESVLWITERKNLLSGLFYLLALGAWLRWRPLDAGSRGGGFRWAAAAMLFFLGAMLSKTVACSLPAAVLLLVYWRRGRVGKEDWLAALPFFLVGLAGALFTTWWERVHVHAYGMEFDLALAERFLVAGRACWFYLGKLLWPLGLSFNYGRWEPDTGSPAQWAWPVAALLLVLALFLGRRRFGRGPLVAALFFGGTLLPALGFVNVYPMRYSFVADHFQYLACLGPLVLFAALLTRLVKEGLGPLAGAAGAVAVILLLGLLTFRQGRAYESLESLWTHTLERNPSSWLAHVNLGMIRLGNGDRQAARRHFTAALAVRDNLEARMNLGALEFGGGNIAAARDHFERAAELAPHRAEPKNNLAYLLHHLGRDREALALVDRALAQLPDYLDALQTKVAVLGALGRHDQALPVAERALRLDPRWVEGHLARARALTGRPALQALGMAQLLAPRRREIGPLLVEALVAVVRTEPPRAGAQICAKVFRQLAAAGVEVRSLARRVVEGLRSKGLTERAAAAAAALDVSGGR